jgi:hypothetical protein
MRTVAGSYDHITRDVRADDAEAFALLEEGQTYDDLPVHLRRYRSDIFTDKYKRLAWDELAGESGPPGAGALRSMQASA